MARDREKMCDPLASELKKRMIVFNCGTAATRHFKRESCAGPQPNDTMMPAAMPDRGEP
jgi:hypothetical protein